VSAPALVLDTGAVMAFADGVEAVGTALADAVDTQTLVALPLICVIEAYSLLDHEHHDLVRVLRSNPAIRVVVPYSDVTGGGLDDCPTIGDMARRAGRLGAGHAAFAALVNAAAVVTSRADQVHAVLGADWPVLEV
jgi:hypothetical protein